MKNSITKYILYILLLHVSIILNAQNKFYLAGELEGGQLSTSYNSISKLNTSTPSVVSSERNNMAIKVSISGIVDFKNKISAELGISQNIRFWNLEGQKLNNNLIVKHRLWYTSIFLGGWYELPILSKSSKFQIYGGSRFSLDFLNFDSVNDSDGSDDNYVISSTKQSKTTSITIIPEIGLKGTFKNGDQWLLGIKYYVPINANLIEGTIKHYVNNNLNETINYKSTGQVLAASFRYNFKWVK